MDLTGILLGAVLFLLTVGVWLWSREQREQTGLPAGEVIYTDTNTWFHNAESLAAPMLKLVGKPDYLIREDDGSIVPVEIKSGRAPAEPHEGHVLQLAAYCVLVMENYRQRPAYGIIQYQDRAYAVDFTPDLEEDLYELLAEMRSTIYTGAADRDHNDWQRCHRCGLRGVCGQRLG
ncbi:MAG: PD-(D/E)XK nuclease family protein [Chloroflexota bacterium]